MIESAGLIKVDLLGMGMLAVIRETLIILADAFLAALINNQPLGFYPSEVLINEAFRHGVRIQPVDVNRSFTRCTIETTDEQLAALAIEDYPQDERGAPPFTMLENYNTDIVLNAVQDAANELYDIIKSRNIGLVVIDSASRAVGGETSTEALVIPFFNAVASWGTTVLTVAHKSKDRESQGPSGVAQWFNQFRNYWEIVKDQTPGQPEVHLAFRHDKANDETELQNASAAFLQHHNITQLHRM